MTSLVGGEPLSPRNDPAPGTLLRRRRHGALAAVLLAAVLALGSWWLATRGRAGPGPSPEAARNVSLGASGVMVYSPRFAEQVRLSFVAAEEHVLIPTFKTVGTVDFDPHQVAAVGARIPGFVRRVFKLPGDRVRRGDALAEVESAAVGQAQADVLAARANRAAAATNEARESALLSSHLTTARESEVARAALASHDASLAAAEERVRALGGMLEGKGLGLVLLRAPLRGTVVEAAIRVGQTVEPNLVAFRVADLSRVWVDLAAFERTVGLVRAGNPVEVVPLTNEGRVMKGRVAHVGEVLDSETRSADLRVEIDNSEGLLRPGQAVSATIHTSFRARRVLAIPQEAVTFVDGAPTVFVARPKDAVAIRAVVLGVKDDKDQEVVSGLAAGERVAVRGVFELKSELFH